MAVDKELLKGTTSTLVLQLLSRKKMYGYEIIQELEILSGGLFEFKEGTLYPLLHAHDRKGIVDEVLTSPIDAEFFGPPTELIVDLAGHEHATR